MMLRISDRYIIRAFLVSLIVCTMALLSLYVVVDSFTNLGEITKVVAKSAGAAANSGRMARFGQHVTTAMKMHAARMPLILYELIPVLTLSAAMFTVAKLRKANEITALLAAGVSIYRVIWPIFLMAIVMTLAQILDREIVMPRYSADLTAWERQRNETQYRFRQKAMMEDGYGNVVFSAKYDTVNREQLGAQITRYWKAAERKVPRVIINAQTAKWESEPAPGWRYRDGWVIQYDSIGNFTGQTQCGPAGHLVPFAAGREQPADQLIVTDATPGRLETKEVDVFYKPTFELLEYAHHHGLRADIALDLNKRVTTPLSNMVLLLLGLPFVLKRNVKSPFLAIVTAVAIAGAYLATSLISENFALEGRILTPLTGAWAPIIIFGPLGVLLFDSVES